MKVCLINRNCTSVYTMHERSDAKIQKYLIQIGNRNKNFLKSDVGVF